MVLKCRSYLLTQNNITSITTFNFQISCVFYIKSQLSIPIAEHLRNRLTKRILTSGETGIESTEILKFMYASYLELCFNRFLTTVAGHPMPTSLQLEQLIQPKSQNCRLSTAVAMKSAEWSIVTTSANICNNSGSRHPEHINVFLSSGWCCLSNLNITIGVSG